MPSSLEYARQHPKQSSLALPAFVCSVCSGPVGVGLALLGTHNSLDESTKELLGVLAIALTLGGAFVFGCVARAKLARAAPPRDRRFANFAIAAPIAWGAAIVALVVVSLTVVIYPK